MMPTSDGWLNSQDAADYTGDDVETVKRAAQAGELIGWQRVPGRSPWKFRRADLDRWVMGMAPA